MAKVSVVQKKSLIGCPERQRRTMRALGFGSSGKIGRVIWKELTPGIRGMLDKVAHLVVVGPHRS